MNTTLFASHALNEFNTKFHASRNFTAEEVVSIFGYIGNTMDSNPTAWESNLVKRVAQETCLHGEGTVKYRAENARKYQKALLEDGVIRRQIEKLWPITGLVVDEAASKAFTEAMCEFDWENVIQMTDDKKDEELIASQSILIANKLVQKSDFWVKTFSTLLPQFRMDEEALTA